MSGEQQLQGPDLAAGVPVSIIPDGGMLVGHAQGQAVLLSRRGNEIFAIGATCTHYSGPLGEGLIVGDTVRCPWHHACFSLRTGEALRAPALSPVSRWDIERRGDTVVVTSEIKAPDGATPLAGTPTAPPSPEVKRVVIVGAGVAGNAAAEMLRRRGFAGTITMLGADPATPYDRPNLSKDYLAGTAEESWLPLHSSSFYKRHDIELLTGTRVTSVDVSARKVTIENGETREFDRLLLATGASPIALRIPGADQKHVFYLRTLADSEAIIAACEKGKRAVVIGASFIGLEVAASLRTRELDVHVVAPEAVPLVKVFGEQLGAYIKSLHEEHGVTFSLQKSVTAIGATDVTLDDRAKFPADMVVIGIGVRPSLELAKQMGLVVDNGVIVNEFLESSADGIYAVGDIASFPYRGGRVRVEHFVVAERQGQRAAENMLGAKRRYDDVPFFWTAQFGKEIRYVGHAGTAADAVVAGDIQKEDAMVAYRENGKEVAFATFGRDLACLRAERALETDDVKLMRELTAR
ncbi:MAG TPA: FAD-dependent oxidoreductase [Gemmatimonadaceae bacterium]|jgi:NADPH-dependent 2,4-dienoyl-CoA reductase/sulfur reductase-like enzyme/nitrite reductase/ring-hydroxylating ferredoxin subunit